MKKKIKLYLDGPNLSEITKIKLINGYTFNPSLFRKLKAKNYLNFTKKILKKTKKTPVSIEVFADDEKNCLQQAIKISQLSKNIYVKIPITYTNGKSTKKLLQKLVKLKIKINVTAIFTLKQIKQILPILKKTNNILSIFTGRIFDIGLDGYERFKNISNYVHKKSLCLTLWASCRMPYDYILAKKGNADIITMSPTMVAKMSKFKISPKTYSLDTVKGFYNDAKKSNFRI